MAFQSLASVTGGNQLTGQARTWYTRVFLEEVYPLITVARFGQSENIPLRSGRTVSWSTMDVLGRAQTLDEGETPSASNVTTGSVTATLQDYGEQIQFSSHVELNAEDPVLTEIAQRMGEQWAQEQDITALEELDTSTNIIRPNSRAADANIVAGDIIDSASIRATVLALRSANVRPITTFLSGSGNQTTVTGLPAYLGFASPLTIHDLEGITGWKSVDKYADANPIFPGEMGMLDQVRFVMTSNCDLLRGEDEGDTNVDVEHTIIMGAGAFGVADLAGRSLQFFARPASQIDSGNPAGRTGSFAYTDEWKVKMLRAPRVRKIHHSASEGANS